MSKQEEQIRAEIEREMLDQVTRAPYDVPEAAKKYADEQLLVHNRELAESGHTRHFKMGYVCFAGYEIEAAFAAGMLAERERLMKEAPVPADVQEAADKAAEKAAYKHYPNSPSYGQFGTGDYQPEEDNSLDREVFVKGFKAGIDYERERLASGPTIKGWVARDGHGCIAFSNEKPSRIELWKLWKVSRDTPAVVLPNTLFPDLRWEDEPKPVRAIIEEIK